MDLHVHVQANCNKFNHVTYAFNKYENTQCMEALDTSSLAGENCKFKDIALYIFLNI